MALREWIPIPNPFAPRSDIQSVGFLHHYLGARQTSSISHRKGFIALVIDCEDLKMYTNTKELKWDSLAVGDNTNREKRSMKRE